MIQQVQLEPDSPILEASSNIKSIEIPFLEPRQAAQMIMELNKNNQYFSKQYVSITQLKNHRIFQESNLTPLDVS
jgi:hypothetical protein